MRDTDVLCVHCNEYISRARERAHRRLQLAPLYSPPHRIPSRLRRVFDVEEPEGRETEGDAHDVAVVSGSDVNDVDLERQATTITAVENLICDRWSRNITNSDEEAKGTSVDEPSSPIDGDDNEEIGWELLEGGLSAWDQLGEGYEQDAAAVGEPVFTRE